MKLDKKIAALEADNIRLASALGKAIADLMGCRDGALVRDLQVRVAMLEERRIAICGGCSCGIAYISAVDSIDSGATYTCEAGHKIVFDVSEPGARAEHFNEITTLRTEKLAEADRVTERDVWILTTHRVRDEFGSFLRPDLVLLSAAHDIRAAMAKEREG